MDYGFGYRPRATARSTGDHMAGFDAAMNGIIKRENTTVQASTLKDGDILTKEYYNQGSGISVDYGRVIGEPWPGKHYGEFLVTILNCFGEQEIVSVQYGVTIRRNVA